MKPLEAQGIFAKNSNYSAKSIKVSPAVGLAVRNASTEGFNNKIRWLITQAYGLRDRE